VSGPGFAPLPEGSEAAVIGLWARCGSLRPWNPPERDIADIRAHPAAEVLVAFDGAQAVGSVVVGHDGHRGWVYYVATDPDRRGEGLGRAAMAAAEDWLRARGVAKLQLLVREGNAGVLGFYEALGYEDGACRLMQKWIDPERDRRYREARHGG
jgi:ribosomal protein S18 acetylase RimI-like enzyme